MGRGWTLRRSVSSQRHGSDHDTAQDHGPGLETARRGEPDSKTLGICRPVSSMHLQVGGDGKVIGRVAGLFVVDHIA